VARVDALMNSAGKVRVLAISGSLRRASSNGALVAAAVHVAPAGVEVSTCSELADVPPFNPDLDTDPGRVIEQASITIPLDGSSCDADGIAQNAHWSGLLTASLAAPHALVRLDIATFEVRVGLGIFLPCAGICEVEENVMSRRNVLDGLTKSCQPPALR
jgi:NADPH-dependent FMN reductase